MSGPGVMTPAQELRLAADLLERAESAPTGREKEGAYFQSLILVAQVLDTMVRGELQSGAIAAYLETLVGPRRVPPYATAPAR